MGDSGGTSPRHAVWSSVRAGNCGRVIFRVCFGSLVRSAKAVRATSLRKGILHREPNGRGEDGFIKVYVMKYVSNIVYDFIIFGLAWDLSKRIPCNVFRCRSLGYSGGILRASSTRFRRAGNWDRVIFRSSFGSLVRFTQWMQGI